MAQRTPSSASLILVLATTVSVLLLLISRVAAAQNQQQYVYGSSPVGAGASQVNAYTKDAITGALLPIATPVADPLRGGPLAVDGQGRFLFIVNQATSNISMFQIDRTSGSLTEVPGSPFSTGPTETQVAASSPVCLTAEKSGNFLYVGYQKGNLPEKGAINEYQIDAADPASPQLVPLPGQPTLDIPSSPIALFTDIRGAHLYVGLGVNASTAAPDAGTQVYSIDPATGQLALVGTAGNAITSGRSIALDPKGRFFFDGWGSTQGVIDSALISPADGTAISGLSSVVLPPEVFPSAMIADGSGSFLYVQQRASPVAYSIDQTTGALTQNNAIVSDFSFIPGSAAADPAGPYIYSLQSDGVHGFLVDPQTGSLSEIPGSPFSTGLTTQGMLTISGTPVQALSGPVAVLFPSSENFGSISLGQSSNAQLVTLTNTGDQGLALNSITVTGANPDDFVATPNCSIPTVLAANVSCTFSVVFTPTAAGLRQANLSSGDNAPGSPQSIPLSGTGVAPTPAVTLAPGSLSFASAQQGSVSAPQAVTVTNSGAATLHISSVLLSGSNPADFAVVNNCAPGAYAAGASCTISITFSPLGAGQRLASIVITDDAPDSPQSILLSGTGAPPPITKPGATLSTNTISFGAVTQGTSATPQNVTLTSSGTATLHISSVVLGGANPTDLTLSNGCNPGAYAVTTTCTITVGFSPIALGPRSATVTINDDAPDSPQLIAISATVNPALTLAAAAPGGTSVAVSAGQTANFNLVVTPGAGLTGSGSFGCTGAPTAATCNAPAVQLTSATPIAYTVSVSTTGNGIMTHLVTPEVRLLRTLSQVIGILMIIFFALTLPRLAKRGSRAQFACRACATAAILAIALNFVGCAGGSATPASVQTPVPIPIVTPKGTSTLMLTPTVTTSAGKQLPALPPIQLTLTVN